MSPKRRTAAAKVRKKKSAPKRKRAASRGRKSGHRVSDVILKTVSHEPKGVSVVALKKALAAGGYDVKRNKVRIKLALKSLVKKGWLVQKKGHGAHLLFKVNTGHVVRKAAKRHGTRTKRAAPRKAAAKKRRAKRAHKKVKRPAAAGARKARKARKSLRKGKKPAGKKVRKRLRKKRVKAVKH